MAEFHGAGPPICALHCSPAGCLAYTTAQIRNTFSLFFAQRETSMRDKSLGILQVIFIMIRQFHAPWLDTKAHLTLP